MCSFYSAHLFRKWATCVGKAARTNERHMRTVLERRVQTVLGIYDLADLHARLHHFATGAGHSLHFSSKVFGTPKKQAKIISMRSTSPDASTDTRMWQKRSFNMCFSAAATRSLYSCIDTEFWTQTPQRDLRLYASNEIKKMGNGT